jgi:Skp family chaperone for outer membrane proteins
MSQILWLLDPDNRDMIVVAVVFVVVMVLFLRDFKLASKRSWMVLIGLTALGGMFFFQAWKRKQLLKEFAEREKKLHDLETQYQQLKDEGKITAAALEKAKADLEAEKSAAAAAIAQADKNLADALAQARKDNLGSSDDELLKHLEDKGINLH